MKILAHISLLLATLAFLMPEASAVQMSTEKQIAHVLNRLTFGPTPAGPEYIKAIGINAYINQQLNPGALNEPEWMIRKINSFESLSLSQGQLLSRYGTSATTKAESTDQKIFLISKQMDLANEARDARLIRQIYSSAQLKEVMVDFWFNHFNISSAKGATSRALVGNYEKEAISPFVLGKFKDLLFSVSKHPAMLYYLDNWKSRYISTLQIKGSTINENYARELMELHTLGVNGGYTQEDVKSLARLLSGWTFKDTEEKITRSSFYFDKRKHDPQEKIFLGEKFPAGGGVGEGEKALIKLAESPTTARHISYKLVAFFTTDSPPPSLVKKAADTYLKTDGDIREILQTIFRSEEFWDEKNFKSRYKTPAQFVVSSVRSLDAPPIDNYKPLRDEIQASGNGIYLCETPDGYKIDSKSWLSPDSILRRINFSYSLGVGSLPLWVSDGLKIGYKPEYSALQRAFYENISQKALSTIRTAPNNLQSVLALSNSDFMMR